LGLAWVSAQAHGSATGRWYKIGPPLTLDTEAKAGRAALARVSVLEALLEAERARVEEWKAVADRFAAQPDTASSLNNLAFLLQDQARVAWPGGQPRTNGAGTIITSKIPLHDAQIRFVRTQPTCGCHHDLRVLRRALGRPHGVDLGAVTTELPGQPERLGNVVQAHWDTLRLDASAPQVGSEARKRAASLPFGACRSRQLTLICAVQHGD